MADDGAYLSDETTAELLEMLAWWRRRRAVEKSRTVVARVIAPPTPPSITFRNDSGEAIPAWAVMRISTHVLSDGSSIVVANKPDGGVGHTYLFNGDDEVPYSGGGEADYGQAQILSLKIRALRDPAYTPATDDKLGPTAGQWYLAENGDVDLLRVIGAYDGDDEEDETLVGSILAGGAAATLEPFELTEALAVGTFADATKRTWGGSSWATDGDSTTVYDSQSLGPAPSGALGWLYHDPNSDQDEIISLSPCPGEVPECIDRLGCWGPDDFESIELENGDEFIVIRDGCFKKATIGDCDS